MSWHCFHVYNPISPVTSQKARGTCNVCGTIRQLHNGDGKVNLHGPRKKPCTGSHKPPRENHNTCNPSTTGGPGSTEAPSLQPFNHEGGPGSTEVPSSQLIIMKGQRIKRMVSIQRREFHIQC